MPQRLTPAAAAAMVDSELKARAAADEVKRAAAAESAAEEKAWQAQVKKMITAAADGHCELVVKRHPIRFSELQRLGLRILKQVEIDNSAEVQELGELLAQSDQLQQSAIEAMDEALSKWVYEIIDRPLATDLQIELRNLIRTSGYRRLGNIFDPDYADRLDEWDPGEIILGAIEDGEVDSWLSLKSLVKPVDEATSQVKRWQTEKKTIQSKLTALRRSLQESEVVIESERQLRSNAPPFKIAWNSKGATGPWPDEPIASAATLSWLAGPGQLMLEAIEAAISSSAAAAERQLGISIKYTNRYGHVWTRDDGKVIHFSTPEELKQILQAVGWKPKFDSWDSREDYLLTLIW